MSNQKRKSRNGGKISRKKQVARQKRCLFAILVLALAVTGFFIAKHFFRKEEAKPSGGSVESEEVSGRPDLDVELLTVNEYSRPGLALEQVNGIVIHYTGNAGSSAKSNRDYFEELKTSHETKASSHFIVGLEGEIVQCIPTAEIAYTSNDRNSDTVSIECCHPDETGQFNEATYNSVVHLTAWLCKKFNLDSSQVIRHYDVTGKDCPKYFVENPDAWEQFRADVAAKINTLSDTP